MAKKHGKSNRAVRLYEELGLLGEVERSEGGHRMYGEAALTRLGWIDKLQVLGMSLNEIRDFLSEMENERTGPAAMQSVRNMFNERLAQVHQQIASLNTLAAELRNGLAYLETCSSCAPNTDRTTCAKCGEEHAVPPPILIRGLHPRPEENTQ